MITQEQAFAALDGFVRSGPPAVEQALSGASMAEVANFADVLYEVADAVSKMVDTMRAGR